jgi:hypothetical protein
VRYVAYFLDRVAGGLDLEGFVAEVVEHVLVQIDATEGVGGGDAEATAQISPGVLRKQAESSRDTCVHALPRAAPLVVGRANECDVQVLHSSVSKQHAKLSWEGDELFVEDQSSTNGTWVNSKRLEAGEATVVRPDDTLRFGQGDAFLLMSPKALFNYLSMLRRFGM